MTPAAILTLVRALRSAVTHAEAHELLVAAVADGLPLTVAAEAVEEWKRERARTVITLEASA
jgi:hypothetical protein